MSKIYSPYTSGEDDPITYDRFTAQNPHLLKMNDIIIGFIKNVCHNNIDCRVLELGAGSGLLAVPLANMIAPIKILAAEESEKFSKHLWRKARSIKNLRVVQPKKIIRYKPRGKFNVVILRLTYHHTHDDQKVLLLNHIKSYLNTGGYLIIGEECISAYTDTKERIKSDKEYHNYRIALARRTGDKEYVADQVRIAKNNLCPYKVSLEVLQQQLNEANYKVIKIIIVKTDSTSIDHDKLGYKVVIAKKD